MPPLLLLSIGACATGRESELARLADWMTGSFSSAAQAAADSTFFDIRLEMMRIWPARDDGVWIYVEQAAATSLNQPYRQRVYRLSEEPDGRWRSTVFELATPEAMIGAHQEPERFEAMKPDELSLREGCHILLGWDGGAFVGSTEGKGCSSALRGATYATSEVRITEDAIVSWDRGWDESGVQVWGARSGGYVFKKVLDY